MGIVILDKALTQEDVDKAREDYKNYIKITIDIENEIVAIGGEYHADAEKMLLEKYNSNQNDIWGGGYDLENREYRFDAMINIRPKQSNSSPDILNSNIKQMFLDIAQKNLVNINKFI